MDEEDFDDDEGLFVKQPPPAQPKSKARPTSAKQTRNPKPQGQIAVDDDLEMYGLLKK